MDREKEELAEAEVIKDSPDSPEPPNKKPLLTMDEMPTVEKAKGKQEELQQIISFKDKSCCTSLYFLK